MLAAGFELFHQGLSGISAGTPCDGPADCPSGKVCAGGTCAEPGNGGPGSACSATRDCSGGNFCDGVTGVCTVGGGLATGASCTSDRQCAPPLRCSLSGFYGTCAAGGTIDLGGACAANADCLSGLWCGANGLRRPQAGVPAVRGRGLRGRRGVPRLLRDAAGGQAARRLLPPAVPERHPRRRAGALDISDFPKPGPTPLGVDLVKLYVDTWTADFDGFSAVAGVAFRFSGDIDYATAIAETCRMVDLTAGTDVRVESRAQLGHQQRAQRNIRAITRWSCATPPRRRSSRGTPTR